MKKVFSMSRTKLALGALVVALVVAPLAALASNSFADVPDSHTFHSHIEWMKDNGITSGCGDGTNYCPDNNVTRGQMAVFLKAVATKQVVDAGSLQGSQPTATVRNVSFTTTSTTAVELEQMDFVVPGPGTLLVTIQGNIWLDADAPGTSSIATYARFALSQTSASMAGDTMFVYYQDPDNADTFNASPGVSWSYIVDVSAAGTETVYLNGLSGDGYSLGSHSTQVTAVFLPGDGTTSLDPLLLAKTSSGVDQQDK